MKMRLLFADKRIGGIGGVAERDLQQCSSECKSAKMLPNGIDNVFTREKEF